MGKTIMPQGENPSLVAPEAHRKEFFSIRRVTGDKMRLTRGLGGPVGEGRVQPFLLGWAASRLSPEPRRPSTQFIKVKE